MAAGADVVTTCVTVGVIVVVMPSVVWVSVRVPLVVVVEAVDVVPDDVVGEVLVVVVDDVLVVVEDVDELLVVVGVIGITLGSPPSVR